MSWGAAFPLRGCGGRKPSVTPRKIARTRPAAGLSRDGEPGLDQGSLRNQGSVLQALGSPDFGDLAHRWCHFDTNFEVVTSNATSLPGTRMKATTFSTSSRIAGFWG